MPISRNLVLTTKNGNKTKTQNITYVNPNAADSDLATFTAALCSLSNNTFVSLNRVDKQELTVQISKPSPELSLDINSVWLNSTGTEVTVTATYLGEGTLSVTLPTGITSSHVTYQINGKSITFTKVSTYDEEYHDMTISVSGTSEYAAESVTVPIKVGNAASAPRD